MANRADRMRDALHQERRVLMPQAPLSNARGWGIGFYHGDEVLHKKRPMKPGDTVNWEQIAGDVHSDCAVLHLRQPTVGDFRPENAHPFRLRSWTFAHRGTIANFESLRGRLAESIPDFLRRNIRGQTDSEYLFHVILSFVHDAGQLDNPDVGHAHLVPAIGATVSLVERLCAEVGAEGSELTCVITNGRSMFALRHGSPMATVQREGLHDPPQDYTPPPAGSTSLRYSMVVSGEQDYPPDYDVIDEGVVVAVDRNLAISKHEL